MPTTNDYLSRAMAAWCRRPYPSGLERPWPSESLSMEVTVKGKNYVVLANGYQVLGVYRIRPQGMLRLLRRWPKDVEAAASWAEN